MKIGIEAFGAYLPRLRMRRQAMVEANAWFNPALKVQGKGACAMANWDEDAVTMAVEAARDCLTGVRREEIERLFLASTSLPFDDRQNSALLVEALNLSERVSALDVASSLRGGLSSLALALRAGDVGRTLIVGSERRDTKVGSPQEMTYGDGAAAILVGADRPIAVQLATVAETLDFTDHYRGRGVTYDYAWEDRWIRDEGHLKLVPRVLERLLKQAGLEADDVHHLCLAGLPQRTATTVAKRCGFSETSLRNPLLVDCGDLGAAHPLLMLAHALEDAKPGERILVSAFGQGCEATLLEATEAIADTLPRRGVSGSLARGRVEDNYSKRLAFRDQVPLDRGMRAELDKATALSAHYRHRRTLLGFVGGRCARCGTCQFPMGQVCVEPSCEAIHAQEPVSFAEDEGRILTYTADRLTYCPDPPQCYGMVTFAQGGRTMLDLTDVDAADVEVGMPVRMVFRIKDHDKQRGFTRYFWKATPATTFVNGQ